MSVNFEDEYRKSIEELHFSSGEKERLRNRLSQSYLKAQESEDVLMKKTLKKVSSVAAALLMATGVTAFAASGITSYTSSSSSAYDYTTPNEMAEAQANVQSQHDAVMKDFPDSFSCGFIFKGGNTVSVKGNDDDGNTIDSWSDLSAEYENKDGKKVMLTMSYIPLELSGSDPTESRVIEGIRTLYNYDEYLLLPADEDYEPDNATKYRMENDDHFYVSYGNVSDKPDTKFFHSILFEKDGISYILNTYDDVNREDLFSMADELITL